MNMVFKRLPRILEPLVKQTSGKLPRVNYLGLMQYSRLYYPQQKTHGIVTKGLITQHHIAHSNNSKFGVIRVKSMRLKVLEVKKSNLPRNNTLPIQDLTALLCVDCIKYPIVGVFRVYYHKYPILFVFLVLDYLW